MNDLQIFKNDTFGQVRILEKDNELWFVAKDVADTLGYQNGSRDVNRHTDEEDRTNSICQKVSLNPKPLHSVEAMVA